MTDDKNKSTQPDQSSDNDNGANEEKALPVHNPFDKNDTKKITPEDIEREQEFKEAQTERD
jgi:hypothetical protein